MQDLTVLNSVEQENKKLMYLIFTHNTPKKNMESFNYVLNP